MQAWGPPTPAYWTTSLPRSQCAGPEAEYGWRTEGGGQGRQDLHLRAHRGLSDPLSGSWEPGLIRSQCEEESEGPARVSPDLTRGTERKERKQRSGLQEGDRQWARSKTWRKACAKG